MRKVNRSITVEAPVDLVYRAWRNFENFPHFMDNIEEVRVETATTSHWKAKGPLGTAPEWDAEITFDEPERTIGWRSIKGSPTKTAGRVDFNGRNARTDIEVTIEYEAPAGVLGEAVAKIFSDPESSCPVLGMLRRAARQQGRDVSRRWHHRNALMRHCRRCHPTRG